MTKTKDCEKSKRAKRQFRGPDGRFMKPTYIFIDDFGDVSPYSHKEPTFGYAYTITDKREEMASLAKDNRRRLGKKIEAKASDDGLCNRIRMTLAIRSLGNRTGASYVDKRRPPIGWDLERHPNESQKQFKSRKGSIRKGVLDQTIDEALNNTESPGVMIVIDEHSALRGIEELCKSKTTEKMIVRGNTFSSSKSQYKDELQTHDYVANAAGSATKGFPLRALMLRMRIHRMRKYERIRR